MENLGVKFIHSILTLIAFLPILIGLSLQVTNAILWSRVKWISIYVVFSALFGTLILAVAGINYLDWNLKIKRSSTYRKELVHGEDDKKEKNSRTSIVCRCTKKLFPPLFKLLVF